MAETREETDSTGRIAVPKDAYWGAQTERARHNFTIGQEIIPKEIISALVLIKKAACLVNASKGAITKEISSAILQACDETLQGKHSSAFPLSVWQTGSGTQTNMNVNEVIANRANELLGGKKGDKSLVHPNDVVNRSQSSNDVFPSAIHIAAMIDIEKKLIPALRELFKALKEKSTEFESIIKVGRTHLMDAAPVSLGQEFSGYATQIEHGIQAIQNSFVHLRELAIGGTAVGTGLNAPKDFGREVCKLISSYTGIEFHPAENRFEALASHDAVVETHGALKRLACSLFKIANDIRWMASGPRAGLHELILPENEPGSSIMPGKVNPTQCEAITMVAVQVFGNDAAITFAGALGNFELNVFKPLIAYNLIQSIRLLSDSVHSFTTKCVQGIQANKEHIKEVLQNSLMLATALNPHVGYDAAAKIVQKAYKDGITLKEAATQLGILTPEEFDRMVDPKKMIYPS